MTDQQTGWDSAEWRCGRCGAAVYAMTQEGLTRCIARHKRNCAPTAADSPQAEADRWNAAHRVGTRVTAYPGCRPDSRDPADHCCPVIDTVTRSRAQVLGGHTAVVWVDGHGACIALTHTDPAED